MNNIQLILRPTIIKLDKEDWGTLDIQGMKEPVVVIAPVHTERIPYLLDLLNKQYDHCYIIWSDDNEEERKCQNGV